MVFGKLKNGTPFEGIGYATVGTPEASRATSQVPAQNASLELMLIIMGASWVLGPLIGILLAIRKKRRGCGDYRRYV